MRVCQGAFSGCAALERGGGNWGMASRRAHTYACKHIYTTTHIYTYLQQCPEIEGGLQLSTTSYWQKKTEQSFHTTCSAARRPKAAQDAPPPILHALAPWAREPRQQKSDHYPLRATSRLSNQFPSETSHSSPPQACCGKMWRFGGKTSTDAQPGGTSWAQTQLQGQKVL